MSSIRFTTFLKNIVVWSPVALIFNEYGFSVAKIKGRSMQPTLNPDSNELVSDVVLLNKFSNVNRKYKVGEVVTLISPTDPKKVLIKRIMALENELVAPLKVNQRSTNAYAMELGKPINPPDLVYIPKGHCWVEGDEPYHSLDSNSFGPVPTGLITAKVQYILFPFNRFGPVADRKIA